MANGKTWFKVAASSGVAKGVGRAAEIQIYNDIGDFGVTAQDFSEALGAAGDVGQLDIRISSNGGDVSTGFAIFNMLERHSARKVVTVDGLAASMASVIAMVGDEVHMPANAMIMIHNPWGVAMGGAEQIKSFGDALEQMQQQIADAYVARTGLEESEILDMMSRETWLSAKKAVSLGFADSVGEALAVQAAFDVSRFNRVPKAFKAENERRKITMAKKNDVAESSGSSGGDTSAKTPAQIRAELQAHAREVRSLCNLAGFPKMADSFIDGDKSLSEVITALDAEKAKASGKGTRAENNGNAELDTHNGNGLDGKPRAEINPTQIYANWNKRGGGGKR